MSIKDCLADNATLELEPRLPPEVEHLIFTAAFDVLDHKTNLTISMVAKRVREWIRPLVYRVVDQVGNPPIPNFSKDGCPPIEEIGQFVHHLVLGRIQQTEATVNGMLPHCPNLKSLSCWYSLKIKSLIPKLATMENLRVLSGDFTGISDNDLCSPAFLRLTHLELICDIDNEPMLELIPLYIQQSQLTHLRLYNLEVWDIYPIDEILQLCPTLRVLILTEPYDDSDVDTARVAPSEFHTIHKRDPRLVILDSNQCNTDDWIKGVKGFYDSWAYADQIITARQNNYFEEGDYQNSPFTSNFDWDAHLNDKGKEWYSEEEKRYVTLSLSVSLPAPTTNGLQPPT